MHIVDPAFTIGSLQCYYVEAVWEDCFAASNEACVLADAIDDPALANAISVYPNPSNNIVNVVSSADIQRVTMMNYVGQIVFDQKVVEDNDLQIGVAGFDVGVYIVKVETSIGIYVKKITVVN